MTKKKEISMTPAFVTDVSSLVTVHHAHKGSGRDYNRKKISAKPFLRSEIYTTGGFSGGNCWDDTTPTYSTAYANGEKELTDLDAYLTKEFPNITFLQYKRIAKDIQKKEYTEYEYYGNTTDYEYKYLELEDLFNALKELNLL